MLKLAWATCQKPWNWCRLETVDLGVVDVQGVYIIWQVGDPGRVLRVGQGDIAQQVEAQRNDPAVMAYRKGGTLYVTWAAVPAEQRGGVVRYLAEEYQPLLSDAVPENAPVEVRLPTDRYRY